MYRDHDVQNVIHPYPTTSTRRYCSVSNAVVFYFSSTSESLSRPFPPWTESTTTTWIFFRISVNNDRRPRYTVTGDTGGSVLVDHGVWRRIPGALVYTDVRPYGNHASVSHFNWPNTDDDVLAIQLVLYLLRFQS